MPFVIRIESPRGDVERIRVVSDSVCLGRGQENDVILKTPLASRRHCRLFSAAGRMMIEDLETRNGTYVLEERVNGARELRVGESVRIPGYVFRLEDETDDDRHPSTTPGPFDRVIDTDAAGAATLVASDESAPLSASVDSAVVNSTKGANRRGFSPLVSYGGGEAAEALAKEAENAFSHKPTEAIMRPAFARTQANANHDTDPDAFESGAEKTDPSVEAHPHGEVDSGRSSSNAGVPVDAREIRASLFQLFLRAVKRAAPPKGKDGRDQLRQQVANAIPDDDERLTHLQTQAWAAEMVEELCGYGPLTPLLANPNVTSVVVEGVSTIKIQRGSALVPVGSAFTSPEALAAVTERLLEEAGAAPEPSDKTNTYRLPSGLEIVVHKKRGEVAPFTVVKPKGEHASGIEARLHRRAKEVAEAVAKGNA